MNDILLEALIYAVLAVFFFALGAYVREKFFKRSADAYGNVFIDGKSYSVREEK